MPAVSVSAGTTLTELSYRDVADAGTLPSGPTALPDPDGFKTVRYREKTATSTPPAEIPAVNKVKPRRQPLIDVSSSLSLTVISSSQNLKD
jgi:hypothetical protein